MTKERRPVSSRKADRLNVISGPSPECRARLSPSAALTRQHEGQQAWNTQGGYVLGFLSAMFEFDRASNLEAASPEPQPRREKFDLIFAAQAKRCAVRQIQREGSWPVDPDFRIRFDLHHTPLMHRNLNRTKFQGANLSLNDSHPQLAILTAIRLRHRSPVGSPVCHFRQFLRSHLRQSHVDDWCQKTDGSRTTPAAKRNHSSPQKVNPQDIYDKMSRLLAFSKESFGHWMKKTEKESSAASFSLLQTVGNPSCRRSAAFPRSEAGIGFDKSAVLALGQNRGELLVRLQAVRRQPLGIVELRLVFVA